MADTFVKSTLKKQGKYIYPTTYYNQVIMPDGSRWDGTAGTAGSDSVHIGDELPENITDQQEIQLWIDTKEEPAVVLPASQAMRKDAVKYKTFNIKTTDWLGSGPYTYTMNNLNGITENTAILNLTLDAASQTYQKAQLDWETGEGYITLSTAIQPTGNIAGYLIAIEVTVI